MLRRPLILSVLVVATAALTGCQSMKMSKPNFDPIRNVFSKKKSEEELKPPVRMAVIWKDGVYEEPGKKSVRGLGGRIYFYDKDDTPTKVEGELLVYGFDDSKPGDSMSADRKFVFPQSELENHYSSTDLGDSYSVWIPWDEVGGVRTAVSLIPVFKTKDGQVLKAGQTLCMLPGKPPARDTADSSNPNSPKVRSFPGIEARIPITNSPRDDGSYVSQASGVSNVDEIDRVGANSATVSYQQGVRRKADTIRVPRAMAERMSQLPAQEITVPEQKEVKNYAADLVKKIAEKKAALAAQSEQEKTDGPFNTNGKFPTNQPVFGKPGILN